MAFRPPGGIPGGPRLILWHDPGDKIAPQVTERRRTGIEIPPNSEAIWYYTSTDMRGEPMIARRCSIQFEYESGPGETSLHEMFSPEGKGDEIAQMFQWVWDDMTKKLDEKEGKKPQQPPA